MLFFRSHTTQHYGYFKIGNETKEQTIERISRQVVVRTFNKYTGEQALFNNIKTSKPGSKFTVIEESRKNLEESIDAEIREKGCDFCDAEKYTSMDLQERLKKGGCITAGNAAKYDAYNGLVIFKEHNLLNFTQHEINNSIDLWMDWFNRTNRKDKDAIYPFLMWNCLRRAGASQTHRHMQTLLTKDMAYSKVEILRKAAEKYRVENGKDYFYDLFFTHEALGLGFEKGCKIMVYLTPTKDKEVIIMDKNIDNLKEPIYNTLRCFIDKLGVFAFNLAIQIPPLNKEGGWEGFPYFVRIVDGGNALAFGTDIAGMELYGTPVIGSDPFRVIEELKKYMNVK